MNAGRPLDTVIEELSRQAEDNRDLVAPARSLAIETARYPALTLAVRTVGEFDLTDHAHGQLAEWLGIPRAYYDRLRDVAPRLFQANVNHWLSRSESDRLLRTNSGTVRAVLSDRYRPLDNLDLLGAALPPLTNRGFCVVSSEVTDTRFYLKAVSPALEREVAVGDPVQLGVVLTNSEIGDGALRIESLLYFLSCTNGMVIPEGRMRRQHIGRPAGGDGIPARFVSAETREAEDRAVWFRVRDTLEGILTEEFLERLVLRLRAAREDGIESDPVKVVEVTAKRFRLSDEEARAVGTHFLAGHAGEPQLTRYGLAQAVTQAAQAARSYDRASELEKLGGVIIDLPPREWRALAAA